MHRFSTLLFIPAIAASCVPPNAEFKPRPVDGLEPAAQIAAGADHTCAVLDNGNLGCWGDNSLGQLGVEFDGAETSTSRPTYVPLGADPIEFAAGGLASCALFADGSISCWGENRAGELGFASACEPASPESCAIAMPTPVPGVEGATSMAVGGGSAFDSAGNRIESGFACAVRDNGGITCWGDNRFGKATGGPPQEAPYEPTIINDRDGFPLRGIEDVSLGDDHVCALDDAGTVRCWGSSESLQLGERDLDGRVLGLGNAVAIGVGSEHSCAVIADGDVYCWGANVAGQSGDRFDNDECPSGSTGFYDCIAVPQRIAISGAIDVAAGDRHTCALLRDGSVVCWGGNQFGQLGTDQVSLALDPILVLLPNAAVAITAGDAHTCALLVGGTVACWGLNESGQVGVPRQ